MFLRDNKWMRTWTQFVPYCVIFVGLGFILGVLSDQFITGWTAPSVQIPRAVISTILVSSFSHTHSHHHPRYLSTSNGFLIKPGEPSDPALLLQPLQPQVPPTLWQDLLLQASTPHQLYFPHCLDFHDNKPQTSIMDKTLLLSVANYVITTTLTSGLLRFWAADSGPTDESGAPTLLVRLFS